MTYEETIAAIEQAIADREMVPAEHAAICWNENAGVVHELLVFDFRTINDGAIRKRIWNRAENTTGACLGSWMKDPRSTPAGVFSGLLTAGMLPDGFQMAWILVSFAEIEGCEWANQMLAAFLEQAKSEAWS